MAWQALTSRRREEVAMDVSGTVQKQARMATGGHDHLLASLGLPAPSRRLDCSNYLEFAKPGYSSKLLLARKHIFLSRSLGFHLGAAESTTLPVQRGAFFGVRPGQRQPAAAAAALA